MHFILVTHDTMFLLQLFFKNLSWNLFSTFGAIVEIEF